MQMKRLFPTSLALLLVMGSLGHAFAAAFCPRMLGHDYCMTRTSGDPHSSQSHQHMHSMMMESMSMASGDMQDMMMDDANVPALSRVDETTQLSNSGDFAPTNKLELPI